MLKSAQRIRMQLIENASGLSVFETLPPAVAVLKMSDLRNNSTYGGLWEFITMIVGDAELQDMGGIGTIRSWEPESGEFGRYDIRFTEPFPNHFHNVSWEVIAVVRGWARIKLGGTVKEWVGGRYLSGGFTLEEDIGPGFVVVIPPNTPQAIELYKAALETNVLMSPPYDPKDSFTFEVPEVR